MNGMREPKPERNDEGEKRYRLNRDQDDEESPVPSVTIIRMPIEYQRDRHRNSRTGEKEERKYPFQQNVGGIHKGGAPGRCGRSARPHPPIAGTVRESFSSHGSGLSKDAPSRDTPATGWMNVSILSPLYARSHQSSSRFTGKDAPRKTAAALGHFSVILRLGVK